jgi:hypothetical protein
MVGVGVGVGFSVGLAVDLGAAVGFFVGEGITVGVALDAEVGIPSLNAVVSEAFRTVLTFRTHAEKIINNSRRSITIKTVFFLFI